MITPIPGWTWRTVGAEVLMTSARGEIRYSERVRPLGSMRDIIRDVQSRYVTRRALRILSIDPLVTDEGEHGALALLGNGTVERVIGVVFGDDFYACCVGHASTPDHGLEDTVRELVTRDSHLLGARRRRYLFTPPPGWVGSRHGVFHEVFRAPAYPRERGRLLVYPATPLGEVLSARDLLQRLTGADADDSAGSIFTTPMGLSGTSARALTNGLVHELVVLQDARYTYAVQLQTSAADHAEHERVFAALVRSIQPIPSVQLPTRSSATAFAWAVD